MWSSFLRNALILGLLSAIGPFAIDMYLPALPSIGRNLGATSSAVQMSLTVFFLSLAIGQPVYGPIADMMGRKTPLYIGLSLFAMGSIGCALAPNIETLLFCRFISGLGACAGMIMPLAIARDLHSGAEAARLMSLVMLVFSISPILAPLAGSFVIAWSGWRAVFVTIALAALLGIVMITAFLPETRPKAMRQHSSIMSALRGYRTLLTDRRFLGTALIGAFGMASFFAYLANSSFVMIGHYGLTPFEYGISFSANAAASIIVAQFNGNLARRFGLRRVVRFGAICYAATMLGLLAVTLAGFDRLEILMGLLIIGFGFLGLVMPNIGILALEPHGQIAGTASALLGTLQFVIGSTVMAVVGIFANGSPLPMIAGIAACATASLIFTLTTLTTHKTEAQALG